MSALFSIKGRIVAYGNNQFNLRGTGYSSLDIIDANGRRIKVNRVGVHSCGTSCIYAGAEGEFFFDTVTLFPGLWGYKHCYGAVLNDGNNFYDARQPRIPFGLAMLCFALPLLLVLIGFLMIPYGLLLIVTGVVMNEKRHTTFYGDPARARMLQQHAVLQM